MIDCMSLNQQNHDDMGEQSREEKSQHTRSNFPQTPWHPIIQHVFAYYMTIEVKKKSEQTTSNFMT